MVAFKLWTPSSPQRGRDPEAEANDTFNDCALPSDRSRERLTDSDAKVACHSFFGNFDGSWNPTYTTVAAFWNDKYIILLEKCREPTYL